MAASEHRHPDNGAPPRPARTLTELGGGDEPVAPGVDSVARLIDHTLLRPEATEADVARVCREAIAYGFAAVCVNPRHVPRVAEALRGTPVQACTVVGFPLGANAPTTKVYETRRALRDGAREIDMVIDIGALRSARYDWVRNDIARVSSVCHRSGAIVKAILETALLTDDEKVAGCEIAREAGADFVKTSTGFGPRGATVGDVILMRRTVGGQMGVKAAGGIRDLRTALEMIAAGATRIGTSAGVRIARGE